MCHYHNPDFLPLFLTYHPFLNSNSTTCVTSGAETMHYSTVLVGRCEIHASQYSFFSFLSLKFHRSLFFLFVTILLTIASSVLQFTLSIDYLTASTNNFIPSVAMYIHYLYPVISKSRKTLSNLMEKNKSIYTAVSYIIVN